MVCRCPRVEGPIAYYNYRAVVKTVVCELENVALKREYNNYKNPDISSSPYIRTLYDVVGPFEEVRHDGAANATEDSLCLVFDWMETDLRALSSHQYRRGSRLPNSVSKSVLSTLDIFRRYNTIHTGKCSTSLSVIDNE